MKKTILALSVLALVFTACKKDKKDEPVTPTKENLTGTYTRTAVTVSSGGFTVDAYNHDGGFEACDKDDTYKLNADLSYSIQDAGTVCSPSNDEDGTWSLSGTTLVLGGVEGTIKSWNGKTLVFELGGGAGSSSYTETYVKQ
jgi:hypothetical protein